MKKLLHVCCANCLSDVVGELTKDGTELVLLFSNPNIHPLVEFRKRRKSVRLMAKRLDLQLKEDDYGLDEFIESLGGHFRPKGDRCGVCYALRLGRAARRARELGCDSFTTTLLVSHHQDTALLVEAGNAAAEVEGVPFEVLDLKHLFGTDGARPKDLKLYRQGYCGCVFSEEERFRETARGE